MNADFKIDGKTVETDRLPDLRHQTHSRKSRSQGNVLVIRALFGAGKVLCFGKKNLVPVPENGRSEKFIIWKQLHIFHDFKQRLRLTQATLAVFIRGFAVH